MGCHRRNNFGQNSPIKVDFVFKRSVRKCSLVLFGFTTDLIDLVRQAYLLPTHTPKRPLRGLFSSRNGLLLSTNLLDCNCSVAQLFHPNNSLNGQWLWLIGRAVASDIRRPRFESSHRQNLYWTLFTINCIEKTKIKKKRPGMAHFLKKS